VNYFDKQRARRRANGRLEARERCERRAAETAPPPLPSPELDPDDEPRPMFSKTSGEELAANAARWDEVRRRREHYQD
jgi:hypothetical protein